MAAFDQAYYLEGGGVRSGDFIFSVIPGSGALRGTYVFVYGAGTAITVGVSVKGATAIAKRPNGNSRLSREPQAVYKLMENGEVVKIGVTEAKRIASRYSPRRLRRAGVSMEIIGIYPNRLIGYAVEAAALASETLRNGPPPRQVNFDR